MITNPDSVVSNLAPSICSAHGSDLTDSSRRGKDVMFRLHSMPGDRLRHRRPILCRGTVNLKTAGKVSWAAYPRPTHNCIGRWCNNTPDRFDKSFVALPFGIVSERYAPWIQARCFCIIRRDFASRIPKGFARPRCSTNKLTCAVV